jgi:hypothetical protein
VFRLGLVLSSVLACGLLFGGSPGLAAEGGGQSAGEAPTIVSESVSNVTEHDATLEAQINTGGLYAGYEFQIDTNSSYNFPNKGCPFVIPGQAECQVINAGEPLSPGLVEPKPVYIQAGSGEQSVSLDLASIGAVLQPDTAYYYRVIVSHGPGAEGPSQTFTTPGSQPSTGVGQVTGGTVTGTGVSVGDARSETHRETKPLTRVQRLARALKACEKQPKNHRAACRKRADRRYASSAKKGR